MTDARLGGSFRDPSGFVFRRDGVLYRLVRPRYREHFDRLVDSGLYETLVDRGLLVPHGEADPALAGDEEAYKVLRPEPVGFVSYPYEWCFGELRDAALATLRIHREALDKGMVLKDASAYNIQFHRGRPVLVDTLSFETYREGQPWVAYRQFCQHFLAPLALMRLVDVRLSGLLRTQIDGVPLDLARRLLPRRSLLRPSLLAHIHLHAGAQRAMGARGAAARAARLSRRGMLALVDSLEGAVRRLTAPRGETVWTRYYEGTSPYSPAALEEKKRRVAELVDRVAPATVWDLGANTGVFSRLCTARGIRTVAFDQDPFVVERLYAEAVRDGEGDLLPLVMDLANPSPSLGWDHRERDSLEARGPADLVLALALVHHLAIANNVPLAAFAAWLARLGRRAVVEWVPKEDPQVQTLLASREDIFDAYRQDCFEAAVGERFVVEDRRPIEGSARSLYLLRARTR